MPSEMELKVDLDYANCKMSAGHVILRIDGCAIGTNEQKKIKFYDVSSALKSLEANGKVISDKFRIALLRAILSCLKDADSSHESTCRVCISDDSLTVNASPAKDETEDAMSLSEISGLILPKKTLISSDLQTIADDFCKQLANKKFCNIEHALKHPIFWSGSNKIRYFEMTWAEENYKEITHKLSRDNNTKTWNLTPLEPDEQPDGESWTAALKIPGSECADLNHDLKILPNSSLAIQQETMIEFAANVPYRKLIKGSWERRTRTYNGRSWKEFLFFFRNVHAHFQEQEEEIRHCFHNDSEDGYWDFFGKRFPGLFINVFKIYKHKVNFKDSAPPKFLPSVHDETHLKKAASRARGNYPRSKRSRYPNCLLLDMDKLKICNS